MTISKKLLLVASLATCLGTSFDALSYYAGSLKSEISSIYTFIETLRKQATSTSEKIVSWLDEKVSNDYNTSENMIVDIAIIIEKNITLDAKTALLLEIIAKDAIEKAEQIEKEVERKKLYDQETLEYEKKQEAETKKRQREAFIALGIATFVFAPTLITTIKLTEDFLYPQLLNWLKIQPIKIAALK